MGINIMVVEDGDKLKVEYLIVIFFKIKKALTNIYIYMHIYMLKMLTQH